MFNLVKLNGIIIGLYYIFLNCNTNEYLVRRMSEENQQPQGIAPQDLAVSYVAEEAKEVVTPGESISGEERWKKFF